MAVKWPSIPSLTNNIESVPRVHSWLGSRSSGTAVPPAPGSQFPKPKIPSQRYQATSAKDSKPKIQRQRSKANDPKPKIQSQRSKAEDPKPKIASQRSKAKVSWGSSDAPQPQEEYPNRGQHGVYHRGLPTTRCSGEIIRERLPRRNICAGVGVKILRGAT